MPVLYSLNLIVDFYQSTQTVYLFKNKKDVKFDTQKKKKIGKVFEEDNAITFLRKSSGRGNF